MSHAKLFTMAADGHPLPTPFKPADAVVQVVWRDESQIPGALFNEVFWIVKDCENPEFVKHDQDQVYGFVGGDFEDPEHLQADVELWLENDKITLTNTSFVFIPAGVAYGKIKVTKHSDKPLFVTRALFANGLPEAHPAEAAAAPGTYSSKTNVVEKYQRADGTLPNVPEGFLKLLLWLDGARLKGAPYMEAVWFCSSKELDPDEDPHGHDFDEFLACIGSDPENPSDLGGVMHFFIEGEEFLIDKSFLLFLPKDLLHCPLYVTDLKRPFLHYTGGKPSVENYSGGPTSSNPA
ncbi:MAG: hypothetical protein LBN12_09030 [Clostridiales Family XIII bacterium]|jgi:hypothetical protein|nr:hypothetical protein [Clostridiales Family XIII bacterium]